MKRVFRYMLVMGMILTSAGCKMLFGPDKTGEFRLSSEKFLSGDDYYQFGYSYEDSEFYRFRYEKDPLPDIINEGTRMLDGTGTIELPSFNTPGQVNGFALAGEFASLEEAKSFYNDYNKVEDQLQFVVETNIIEPYQVWIQKTSSGNFVKLLVKEANSFEGEGDVKYSEALLEYTYQPKDSDEFPD